MSGARIAVLWAPESVQVRPGLTFENPDHAGFEQTRHATLRQAVTRAIADRESRHSAGLAPWIKFQVGDRVILVDEGTIVALDNELPPDEDHGGRPSPTGGFSSSEPPS